MRLRKRVNQMEEDVSHSFNLVSIDMGKVFKRVLNHGKRIKAIEDFLIQEAAKKKPAKKKVSKA